MHVTACDSLCSGFELVDLFPERPGKNAHHWVRLRITCDDPTHTHTNIT